MGFVGNGIDHERDYHEMSDEELIDAFNDHYSLKCKLPETRGGLISAIERAKQED